MDLSNLQTTLLCALIVAVLVLPLTLHKVEKNLEAFLFICGTFAVTVSHLWSGHLIITALKDPIKITLAVLIAGFLFKRFHRTIQHNAQRILGAVGLKITLGFLVFYLGMISSLITAIIAALGLSEIVPLLPLSRKNRIRLVVYACYSIGMGAVLTSIGEPLGTIVISKLSGAPHYAGFFYLIQHLGWYVLLGTVLMAVLAARLPLDPTAATADETAADPSEHTWQNVSLRAGKIYLFVMALVLLGDGLKPLAAATITHLSADWLYWINTISAILDNATLAAIEITPDITDRSLTFLLMSLIISGGMLIPGTIPNIICASKLKITSKEWAKAAVPIGIVLMVIYFVLLHIVL